MTSDKGRIDFLAQLLMNCPGTVLSWNDSDGDDDLPNGFNITIEGCSPVEVNHADFRECIDACYEAMQDDGEQG